MGFLLSAVMLATSAHAQIAWDWSQNVNYQENHDPSVIWLTDGRRLKVAYPAALPWATVHAWSRGRGLLLAYRPESGLVLADRESGKTIPVLRGLEKHPIELLTETCVQKNPSTSGYVECYGEGRQRWEREMNRADEALSATLGEPQRLVLKESQRRWREFQEAELSAIDAINDRQGTIWRVESAEQGMRLVEEQAERLANQLDPL